MEIQTVFIDEVNDANVDDAKQRIRRFDVDVDIDKKNEKNSTISEMNQIIIDDQVGFLSRSENSVTYALLKVWYIAKLSVGP